VFSLHVTSHILYLTSVQDGENIWQYLPKCFATFILHVAWTWCYVKFLGAASIAYAAIKLASNPRENLFQF